MNEGRLIFAQLMDLLPRYEFRKCVDRYQGNHRVHMPVKCRVRITSTPDHPGLKDFERSGILW